MPVRYGAAVRDVVIDTDMGADDWMAILLPARSAGRARAGDHVSGTGVAHCGAGRPQRRAGLAGAGTGSALRWRAVASGRCAGGRTFPRAWRRDATRSSA